MLPGMTFPGGRSRHLAAKKIILRIKYLSNFLHATELSPTEDQWDGVATRNRAARHEPLS